MVLSVLVGAHMSNFGHVGGGVRWPGGYVPSNFPYDINARRFVQVNGFFHTNWRLKVQTAWNLPLTSPACTFCLTGDVTRFYNTSIFTRDNDVSQLYLEGYIHSCTYVAESTCNVCSI